jgi:hypothetical protein
LYLTGMVLSVLIFLPYLAYNASTLLDFPSLFLLGLPFAVWIEPDVNMTLKEAARFVVLSIL